MRILSALVVTLCFCSGCSVGFHRTLTATEVDGFGSGATKTEASQAAWDDAIARIDRMGIEGYRVARTGEINTHNGQGVYETKVTLLVQAEE